MDISPFFFPIAEDWNVAQVPWEQNMLDFTKGDWLTEDFNQKKILGILKQQSSKAGTCEKLVIIRIPRNLVWSHQAKRWNFNSRWFHPEIFEVCGDRNHGIEHNQHRLKPWRQLPGAFYVGNGWVAGGCWDDDITNVMTGIIPSFPAKHQ